MVCTNRLAVKSRDIHFPFRANSNFLYMCGIKTPHCALIIQNNHSILVGRQSHTVDLWDGHPSIRLLKSEYGIDECVCVEEYATRLHAAGNFAVLKSDATFDRSDPIHRVIADHGFGKGVDVAQVIHMMRIVKSKAEQEMMRYAASVTARAMHSACNLIRFERDCTEARVAGFVRFMSASMRAEIAFPSIVAFDENAKILHHSPTNQTCCHAALLDIGAEYDGYASDMSRSICISSNDEYKSKFEARYRVVQSAHDAALRVCAPGSSLARMEAAAREALGEYAAFCPHAIAHWVGMDVHDVGDESVPLECGMCVALEPAIYVDDVNIRLENTLLVATDGAEVLTDPREMDATHRVTILRLRPRKTGDASSDGDDAGG